MKNAIKRCHLSENLEKSVKKPWVSSMKILWKCRINTVNFRTHVYIVGVGYKLSELFIFVGAPYSVVTRRSWGYVLYYQMEEIELFRVLVVRFVLSLSLMVPEISSDITIILTIISKAVKNLWNCQVFCFMKFSQHFICFTGSARNITPKSHGIKSRGFHRTVTIHRIFTDHSHSSESRIWIHHTA